MSTIINATTTNGVVIQPDNSGSLVLQTNSGTTALTIDTSQNVAFAKGFTVGATAAPAFWVHPGADTTVSSATDTVIANTTELYDTANCFNNTGSTVGSIPAYAFLPNIAGYYFITSAIMTELSTAPTRFINVIRINGGTTYRVGDSAVGFAPAQLVGSMLIYLNGTTDYVQQLIYLAAGTPRYSANTSVARFSGFLARSA